MRRPKVTVAIALVFLVIAGIGAIDSTALSPGDSTAPPMGPAASEPTQDEVTLDSLVQSCAATLPDEFADPANESGVIGWVDGYWYDEPIEINATDGLSDADLRRLSARTAARVEALRCLDAGSGSPPVEVLDREQFRENQSAQFADIPANETRFDNAKLETMLLVSSTNDSIEQRERNRGGTVGGSYDPGSEEINIVTDGGVDIDEPVLAHELGHAIQDQQFNLSQYGRETSDVDAGILGLIEGDVSLIEQRYRTACEAELWSCVSNQGEAGDGDGSGDGDPSEPANWGLYFESFQPYSDGPSFVEYVFDRGGWAAVNDLYEEPPRSAYYVVKPDSYGSLDLANISVPDRSTDRWERLTLDGPDYDTVGVAGISAMFIAPTYESRGAVSIYEPREILNLGPDGEVNRSDPLNYLQPETEGWRDDKIYVYRDVGTNQTATVWELAWATPADVEQFVESYESMIAYRGGQPVAGLDRTYEFGPDSEYEMALRIESAGDRVTVVTAPTVDALGEVHGRQ